jgi:hypothetical protein
MLFVHQESASLRTSLSGGQVHPIIRIISVVDLLHRHLGGACFSLVVAVVVGRPKGVHYLSARPQAVGL